MGVFDDKKFEELDWISQATEPIDSELNIILAAIPDVVNIDFDFFSNRAITYSFDMSIGSAVYRVASPISKIYISTAQMDALTKCFEFQFTSPEVVIDFEQNKILGGEIKLVKILQTIDEKQLTNILGRDGIDLVQYNADFHKPQALSRVNEVMEILGKCDQGLKTRSYYKKKKILSQRLMILFKDNEWNIKDTELANKIGRWIKEYINDGTISSFGNLCKLKVMTHKGQPIYSMEEIV